MARVEGSGRKKGTPNKITSSVKASIDKIIAGQMEQLEDDLSKLTPFQRVRSVTELMKYVVPVKQEVETNTQLDLSTFLAVDDNKLKELYGLN